MSHAGRGAVAGAVVLLSLAQVSAEPAVVQSKLNLRSGPGLMFATLAVLPRETKLDLHKCSGEWCRVSVGRQVGYVSRVFLKTGEDSFASAAPQAAPVDPKPSLAGPHIWRWRDSHWRDENWRRIEWHNRFNR